MTQRFRRPFTAFTSPTAKNCARNPGCKCCAAIRRARDLALFDPLPEYGSPLTPGVQLVNLSQSEDGQSLRVDLSTDWARMFGQLTQAGEGLVMTRNEAAILGRCMKYPELNVTSGGGKGANGEGGLWIDFRRLGGAWVLHQRRQTGHVFGVVFADQIGRIVHRFTLTPESDMNEFFAWMRLHQACTAHPPAAWLEDEEEAAWEEPVRVLRRGDAVALTSIVAACVDRAVPLRATVRGGEATQRAEFTPRAMQSNEDWWFVSDDVTGLHFQPEFFSRVTLEQPTRDNGESRLVVCATVEEDGAALVLEAGSLAAEADWQALLEATV